MACIPFLSPSKNLIRQPIEMVRIRPLMIVKSASSSPCPEYLCSAIWLTTMLITGKSTAAAQQGDAGSAGSQPPGPQPKRTIKRRVVKKAFYSDEEVSQDC